MGVSTWLYRQVVQFLESNEKRSPCKDNRPFKHTKLHLAVGLRFKSL